MYARRVNRRVRHTNRQKPERHPPVAVVGNQCRPFTSFNIDKRTFINHILPSALANNWIKNNGPLEILSMVLDTPSTDTQILTMPVDTVISCDFYWVEKVGADGNYSIEIYYSNGNMYTFVVKDTIQGANAFRVYVTSNSANATYSSGGDIISSIVNLDGAFITQIKLVTANMQFSTTYHTTLNYIKK